MATRPHLASLFALSLLTAVALAAPPSEEARKQAAAAFDQGVQAAGKADYDAAARAFLRADELAPSATALTNAMAAARRGNIDLLVVEAAQRALDRDDAQLAATAREALADAERRVARLEISCDPGPCDVKIDGNASRVGKRYVVAGDHVVTGTKDGIEASQKVTAVAGTVYRVVLNPKSAAPRASAAPATSAAPTASAAPTTTPDAGAHKPLAPAYFYVGAAVTVVLAGVTTWSGLDALSNKSNLPPESQRTGSQVDDARSRIRRTDYFLAGTVLVGAVTAVAAFTLVDWGKGNVTGSAGPGGASLSLTGSF